MLDAANKFEKALDVLYCPSMAENIERGTCHQYWPTQAAMLRHEKGHHKVLIVIEEETEVGAKEEELTEESSTSNKMKYNV